MNLFVAMLCAPLIGISRRWPSVLHAVDADEICRAWPDGTVSSVCGVRRLRLVGTTSPDVEGVVGVEWPPRVAGLPPEWSRCRVCHELTGRRRPRSKFRATVDA